MRGKKIVLDLEFIPYRRKQEPYCVHEIIEIGAVALDADNEIYDEFQMYVKPQYGTVPPFVTAITGITNEMLVALYHDIPYAIRHDWFQKHGN